MRFLFVGFSVLVMTAQLASAQNQCSEVGLTWTTLGQHAETGATHVGVDTLSNPYQGDTACTEKRPVLCINTTVGFDRPHHLNVPEAPVPASGSIPVGTQAFSTANFHAWSAGAIAASPIVAGCNLETLTEANDLCRILFGDNWRVAEYHDGVGHGLWAYGTAGSGHNRFWVNINDQPNGTCWTQ
jgi:hypothetical protein